MSSETLFVRLHLIFFICLHINNRLLALLVPTCANSSCHPTLLSLHPSGDAVNGLGKENSDDKMKIVLEMALGW